MYVLSLAMPPKMTVDKHTFSRRRLNPQKMGGADDDIFAGTWVPGAGCSPSIFC